MVHQHEERGVVQFLLRQWLGFDRKDHIERSHELLVNKVIKGRGACNDVEAEEVSEDFVKEAEMELEPLTLVLYNFCSKFFMNLQNI